MPQKLNRTCFRGRTLLVAASLCVGAMALPLAPTNLGAQEASKSKGASKQAMTAKQIMDEMNAKNSALGVSSGEARIELVIEDRTGTRRTRELVVRSKSIDDASRTLVRLTAPRELDGQAFLFAENKKGEDDVWMYLPAFKVSRRVEGSQKRGAFLGSHFSFSDLESRDLKDGEYKRLDDEKIGKDDVFVISVTPRDASSSDYGQVIAYVRQSDYMPLKMKFYDKEAASGVSKTLFVEKISKDDAGNPYITQMTLRSKKGGYSTIVISGVDTKKDLPDTLFTKDQLGK